jgi:beta-lactamase class A
MYRTITGPVFCVLAVLLCLSSLPSATLAAGLYDVSYVWSRDIDGVRDYRKRVAGVLGKAVAKDLKVVSNGKLFGLVYARRGDSAGATRVAQSHTKLLRARGLQAASPVRSENWTLVGDTGARQAAVASPGGSSSPKSRKTAPTAASPEVAGTPKSKMITPAVASPGVTSSPKRKATIPAASPGVPSAPKNNMSASAVASSDVPSARISEMTTTERSREIHNLEAAVMDYLNRLRQEGKLAPDERTGWSVYDFTTGEKLVTINEDEQFQTASLVKPFIAAAFFHKVERGELTYNKESRRHLQRMIQHSNNASTNWVMRRVGGPQAVERILNQQYPEIFQEVQLVEYIPAGGKTYRNKASVHDYSRFLYALWKEEIAGAPEIKRLMALPGHDRIYTGVRGVPKDTKVYNKTGSTARLCGDMGILNVKGADGKWYPYTLVGIIEKGKSAPDYTSWIRSRGDIIRNISSIVYKGIAQQNDI